jgi:hypothetical protein
LLRDSVAAHAKQAAHEKDRGLINRHAETLNAEIEDVLGFQTDL